MTERLLCKIKFYDISRAVMSCMYNVPTKEGYLDDEHEKREKFLSLKKKILAATRKKI